MKKTYYINGMTCKGCVETVTRHLKTVMGVDEVRINLEKGEAVLSLDSNIVASDLKEVLPHNYQLSEKKGVREKKELQGIEAMAEKSKLAQLKPLIFIFFYITVSSILIHMHSLDIDSIMLDFMGLFYVVFSFFKLLDFKGFPASFGMYDPLAKRIPLYGKIYPFIEVVLGLMFLMRFQLEIALVVTLLVLGITTVGVIKSLLDKKTIRCACLGTVLKLPMTEATFIENAIMLVMALILLLKLI